MKITFLFFSVMLISSTFAQIPIKSIRKEIKSLKTEEKIEAYWKAQEAIDQKVIIRVNEQPDFVSTIYPLNSLS